MPHSQDAELSMSVRLTLYQDAVDNLRLAKQQQWNVAYYTVAVVAGIIGLRGTTTDQSGQSGMEPPELWILTFSGVLLSWAATYYLCKYQAWMVKSRSRCTILLKGLPDEQRKIWTELRPQEEKGFFYDADFFLVFALVGVLAAFLIGWYVSRALLPALFAALFALILSAGTVFCIASRNRTANRRQA
jgi:hypothetical protein